MEKTADFLEQRKSLPETFKTWLNGTISILEGWVLHVLDVVKAVYSRDWVNGLVLPPYIDADLNNGF